MSRFVKIALFVAAAVALTALAAGYPFGPI